MFSIMDNKKTIRDRVQNGIAQLDYDDLKRVQLFLADLTAERIEQEAERLTIEGSFNVNSINLAVSKVRNNNVVKGFKP